MNTSKAFALAAAGVLAFGIAGCATESTEGVPEEFIAVTKAELGDEWPYTVDGIIKCQADGVWFLSNGKDYPVNGIALNRSVDVKVPIVSGANPQPDDEVIRIKETLDTLPTPTVINKSASEIIQIGLELCEAARASN
jgi:hypothetical protein